MNRVRGECWGSTRLVGVAIVILLVNSLGCSRGGGDEADRSTESAPTTAAEEAVGARAPEEEARPPGSVLSAGECTALVEVLERGAPSPIDGSVSFDLSIVPEEARPAIEVLLASYREVLAAVRAGELPNVDEDVSGLVEVAEGMSAPEVVAAVAQLEGMVESC